MVGAVDIGGTKIAVGIVAEDGRLLARKECPTSPDEGYPAAIIRIERLLQQLMETSGVKIVGIGIGSTGPVDPFTGEIGDVNFFPTWRGSNPVKDLTDRFRVSVAMENDADAAALGEAAWGTGRDRKRMVYVTVGTGIGGGMIFDGRLYRGVDRSHPEIGHHVIDASGPACMCGFHGCWESLAAGPAMSNWMEEQMRTNGANPRSLTAKQICEMAGAGHALARRAVDREAHYLGLGLANLLFTPDAIVLGGGVMKSANLFLPGIHKVIRESCRFVPYDKVEVAVASLGDNTNLIGAARVWHHRFFMERGTSA
jgi:glucokinase